MCEASLKNERRKEKEIKDLMSYERKQYPDFDLEWLERKRNEKVQIESNLSARK